MKKNFIKIISTAVPIKIENIDTDQIIPARFLKTTLKEGIGENLFRDWRFYPNGNLKKNFILNNPIYKGKILISEKNFGCGSSREHAIWALIDYGFRVIISSFFADIFEMNALNNGLLIVKVSNFFLQKLFINVYSNPNTLIKIDLENQFIHIENNKKKEKFKISFFKKICLINGYNDIDFLISIKNKIKFFEKKHNL